MDPAALEEAAAAAPGSLLAVAGGWITARRLDGTAFPLIEPFSLNNAFLNTARAASPGAAGVAATVVGQGRGKTRVLTRAEAQEMLKAGLPGRERGGRVKSPEYRAWRNRQCIAIMQAGPRVMVRGPVELGLLAPESGADVDNVVKAYVDAAVEMRLMEDDRNVRGFVIGWIAAPVGFGLIVPCRTHPEPERIAP
ncbi:MAG: hypothetical protein ACE37J_11790 [Pikeienuella sp.]|uniref:hypothetical protein n=1 Tax=Pikeienuella sp. TaxID=2831957 RepID=UPI00391D5975